MLDARRDDLSPYAQGLLDADEAATGIYNDDPIMAAEYMRGLISGLVQALGQRDGDDRTADFMIREGERRRALHGYATATSEPSWPITPPENLMDFVMSHPDCCSNVINFNNHRKVGV